MYIRLWVELFKSPGTNFQQYTSNSSIMNIFVCNYFWSLELYWAFSPVFHWFHTFLFKKLHFLLKDFTKQVYFSHVIDITLFSLHNALWINFALWKWISNCILANICKITLGYKAEKQGCQGCTTLTVYLLHEEGKHKL